MFYKTILLIMYNNLHQRKQQITINGLKNLGNTCYINVILQALNYTMPLTNYLFLHRFDIKKPVTTGLKKVIYCLKTVNGPISPEEFKSILEKKFDICKGYMQNDSAELLNKILNAMHEEMKVTQDPYLEKYINGNDSDYLNYLKIVINNRSPIHEYFGGTSITRTYCTKCGTQKNRYEGFIGLEVEIYGNTLKDCLEHISIEEELRGQNKYDCEKCKELTIAKKDIRIWTLPEILTINLKRFKNNCTKINNYIEYPENLDMNTCKCYISDTTCKYNLYSVIEHHGSFNGGHYTIDVKYGNNWYQINDDRVIPGSFSCKNSAYILFYKLEKMNKTIL